MDKVEEPSSQTPTLVKTVFVLVHGTWARNADWIGEHAGFASQLTSRIPAAKTRAFRWSGRNSDRDRASAGEALVRETSALRAEYPEAEVVVIGHSHGGNVALNAYREAGGPESIDKIICLGTPFFHFAARALKPAASVIATGLIAVLCLTIVLHRVAEIWTSSVVPIVGSDPNQRIDENTGLPEFNEDEYSKFLIAAMRAGYSIVFFAALPPLLFLAVKPLAWICEKLLGKLQGDWLTRHPPPTSYPPTFVLYTKGDEARGWLWFIERVWRPVFTGLFVIGQISTKTLILAIPLGFVAIGRSITQNRSDDFIPYFGAFGNVVLLVGFTYLSTLGALFLSFLAMAYGTLVAGTPWGFGTTGLISYQLISVRVNYCPDGLTNVQVQEVKLEKPPGPRTLRHSLFYSSDVVVDHIARWMSGASKIGSLNDSDEADASQDSRKMMSSRTQWLWALALLLVSWLFWKMI